MFICVSLNPAIDKRLTLQKLTPGKIHRVRSVRAAAGGKATHVAMVLLALGERPSWVGLCGGPAGEELLGGLKSLGIDFHPYPVQSATRTNVEIQEEDGTVTEILEPGGLPSAEELDGFRARLAEIIRARGQNAIVIFSGSLPSGTSPDLYEQLVSLTHSLQARPILDTSGEPLRAALQAGPLFVKPNREEAEALLGTRIESIGAAAEALRQILDLGARSAAVSLGSDGMYYCPGRDSAVYFAPSLKLSVRSAVGCGDAALAGFARAISSGMTPEDTLRMATACAAANCGAESPGAVQRIDIERFLGQIDVQRIG